VPGTNFKQKRVKLTPEEYEKLKKAVMVRDGYRCRLCLSMLNLSVDHIVKRSQGGGDTMENLRTLCWICHNKVDNEAGSPKSKKLSCVPEASTEEGSD
jgi:5-methylcytosine-specific restriction endonuclease McrA